MRHNAHTTYAHDLIREWTWTLRRTHSTAVSHATVALRGAVGSGSRCTIMSEEVQNTASFRFEGDPDAGWSSLDATYTG